jgi:hypothetical protein
VESLGKIHGLEELIELIIRVLDLSKLFLNNGLKDIAKFFLHFSDLWGDQVAETAV